MATLPDGRTLTGKLIIVEGIDGSGKSTQLDLLRKWLIGEGYCVAYSEWNSSPIVGGVTRRGKKKQLLTPLSFCLIHAADFADRMERQMLPALKAGAIVLADRYMYTAFGRDVARGIDRGFVRRLYSFAIRPTIAFYFRVPLEESLRRILTGRPQLKYYEAGLDIGLSDDPYESFKLFQSRILEEYDRMVEEFNLTVIDATRPLLEQQDEVRAIVAPHLRNVLRIDRGGWREVLAAEGLHGRYLQDMIQTMTPEQDQ
ncbi:MAG TPA: thymidylate kinase [Chloroflexi bacterium]|nr:thymidylate kinase [Chloroflexota bacterium]